MRPAAVGTTRKPQTCLPLTESLNCDQDEAAISPDVVGAKGLQPALAASLSLTFGRNGSMFHWLLAG
ncbi:hypothetical protein D3C81_1310630 [compost metagenome]